MGFDTIEINLILSITVMAKMSFLWTCEILSNFGAWNFFCDFSDLMKMEGDIKLVIQNDPVWLDLDYNLEVDNLLLLGKDGCVRGEILLLDYFKTSYGWYFITSTVFGAQYPSQLISPRVPTVLLLGASSLARKKWKLPNFFGFAKGGGCTPSLVKHQTFSVFFLWRLP